MLAHRVGPYGVAFATILEGNMVIRKPKIVRNRPSWKGKYQTLQRSYDDLELRFVGLRQLYDALKKQVQKLNDKL